MVNIAETRGSEVILPFFGREKMRGNLISGASIGDSQDCRGSS